MTTIDVRRLGTIDYDAGVELQKSLVEDRRAGRIGDTLLLLEHPPVITLGVKTRGQHTHIVASDADLQQVGVTVHETGRGGDITYHGPGQLVGYPIFDLRPDRCDVHKYVRDLEEVLIRAIAEFGIDGRRVQGLTGVWVGAEGRENKIAAIGIRISRWITSHGFALNVTSNLDHFKLIVPCGIVDRGVTSIALELELAGRSRERPAKTGRAPSMADVQDAVVRGFEAVFSESPARSETRFAPAG